METFFASSKYLKAASLLERSTIVAKRCQVKFLQPSTTSRYLFLHRFYGWNHPCNFDTALGVKLITANEISAWRPYGHTAAVSRRCFLVLQLHLSQLRLFTRSWPPLEHDIPKLAFWSARAMSILKWSNMEYPELEHETMKLLEWHWNTLNQVTSHGAINISKLETAVPGASSEFHTRNDIGPQKISPDSERSFTPGISLFEQEKPSRYNWHIWWTDRCLPWPTYDLTESRYVVVANSGGDVHRHFYWWCCRSKLRHETTLAEKKTKASHKSCDHSLTHHWWNIRILSNLQKFSRFLLLFASSNSNCV